MSRPPSTPKPRRRKSRSQRKVEIPVPQHSNLDETPLSAALFSNVAPVEDAQDQFAEVIPEAEPNSVRSPVLVAPSEPEVEEHAPWLVEELEKFAGSRWRFVATVTALTLLGLLVRERGEMRNWLSALHLAKPVRAQVVEAPAPAAAPTPPCPDEMALVSRSDKGVRVCVDKWEASLVEILPDGEEKPWSPYLAVDDSKIVKAVSKPGVVPQGYIDRDTAEEACEAAGKRLCQVEEWTSACEGPDQTTYPYGAELDETACNIHGKSPLGELFGSSFKDHLFDYRVMNDPSLNALEGTVAKTGAFDRCANGWGLHDMVGNLHEWTAEKKGVFRGGYYQDANKNGPGCRYATSAHLPTYHDYSTGFRCCKDAE